MFMSDITDEELEIMNEADENSVPVLEGAVSVKEPIKKIGYSKPVNVSKEAKLSEVIELLSDKYTSCVCVVEDKNKLVGIFTERDVVRKIASKKINIKEETVEKYMTVNPVSLKIDDPLAFALNKMSAGGFRHVPLVNKDGNLVGLLSFRSIIEHLADYYSNEVLNLPPEPETIQSSREGG